MTILEYNRPRSLADALALLSRPELTLPMGGGTVLNGPHQGNFAVVDLQELPLAEIERRGKYLDIGAASTLSALAEVEGLPEELRNLLRRGTPADAPGQATTAGALISANGRTYFAGAMLALDARATIEPGGEAWELGALLHSRTHLQDGLPHLAGRLVTRITLNTEAGFAFELSGDHPGEAILFAAAAAWPSGRLRIILGGWGGIPRLALDAPEPGGVEAAAASAAAEAGDDRASAAFRRELAPALARRAADRALAAAGVTV